MDLELLKVFLAVTEERSFSRAAGRLYRTQPAVSQAVHRLEHDLGERLFDRASRDAPLTEAGRLLEDYARRLLRLAEETEAAVRELHDLRRGRVLVGANEAGVQALLPVLARFHASCPQLEVDVRRVPTRQIPAALLDGSLDFGVLTFDPGERLLQSLRIGTDELVLLLPHDHRLARRRQVRMADLVHERVIAHNDPSPVRERVLRSFEQRRLPLDIHLSLPSLDAIKRAVELGLGVALLPRRCAVAELASSRLVAVRVAHLRWPRQLRLAFRASGDRSRASAAFLKAARDWLADGTDR
ncbi:MAG: LysR family transcriptional regulator [Bacteroidales bacterium]